MASRKRTHELTFACQHCPADAPAVSAPEGDELDLTRLCRKHFDVRHAKGTREMKAALAEEARRHG